MIHDDGPRINWRLAVLTKLLTGGDSPTRAAEIRTSTGTTNRPITKLYPLEVNSGTESSQSTHDPPERIKNSSMGEETLPVKERPTRQSARRAAECISEWTQTLRAPLEDVET